MTLAGAMAAHAFLAVCLMAQQPVPPPGPSGQMLSPADLDQLLGPIALYPDPLLSELLPAAEFPSEIVLADRYVQSGGDPNLIDQQPWDDSVKALARYPSVLKWMDDNLAWTTAVGQAFENQSQDVMDSVQRLRAQASALGNLQSTPQENVVPDSDGTIEILPANPDEIYVPVYQPSEVFYDQAAGVPFISFSLGLPIGGWLHNDFDWHNHHVVVWNHDHPRPPGWWSHGAGGPPRVPPGPVPAWQPHNRPGTFAPGADRGWAGRPGASTVSVIGGGHAPPRPTPAPEQRPAEAPHASGALIGGGSSHEARQDSNRGQESRAAMSAPSHGGGGKR